MITLTPTVTYYHGIHKQDWNNPYHAERDNDIISHRHNLTVLLALKEKPHNIMVTLGSESGGCYAKVAC